MRVVLRVGTEETDLEIQIAPDQVATVADLVGGLRSGGAPATGGLRVDGMWWPAASPLLEVGLRRGAVLEPADADTALCEPPALVLRLATGLDAGRCWSLAPGSHLAGRHPACRILLDHPSVAPRHALILVAKEGSATVRQLSAGGSQRTPETCLATTLQLGDVELRVGGAAPCPPQPYGPDGRIPFSRRPRARSPAEAATVTTPAAPEPTPPAPPFSWASALVPLGVSGVLALVFGPLMAVFALLSPLVLVGSWWEHRRRARRQAAQQQEAYQAALARFGDQLAEAAAAEVRRRTASLPDLGEIVGRAETGSPRLWERRQGHLDALVLRLGRGRARWDPPTGASHTRAPSEMEALLAATRTLPSAPIGLDLKGGPVGIVGDGPAAQAVARGLVLQAAVLHGPADLSLDVDGAGPTWSWARWLPHHGGPPAPWHLAVIDRRGHSPGTGPPLPPLARPHATAVVLARTEDELPSWCTSVLRCLDTDGRAVLTDLEGGTSSALEADGVSAATALRTARHLARFTDPEQLADAALPATVTLAEVAPLEAAAIASAWARPGSVLPAVLGIGPAGPVAVDLTVDGPHTLIAGTTGAGKSELLRTLVAALAARSGPDDLAFVLIDFKGGSAFDRCADLPHVTGVVTDLDGHLAARVLRSLEAEVRHREARLRAAGATDLTQLWQAGEVSPPLPRLVVAVDELAVLAAEVPDFLPALIDIAQRGRSLGIHLVLATQRPSGSVSDRIRANTNLRFALRTIDAADSTDLIGSPAAAHIDRRHPGRVWMRSGGDPPTLFQAATGASRSAAPDRPPVVVRRWPPAPPEAGDGPDDLERLITAIRTAADAAGTGAPRRPWLPPLPTRVRARRQVEPGGGVVMALADDPHHQRRTTWCWHPPAGHLVVHGAPRSGVTTALQRAAAGVGALGGETLVAAPDRSAVQALVARLHHEVGGRQGGTPDCPPLAVLIDRWPSLAGACTDLEGMRLLDDLVRLLADGAAVGVVGLIGLDRSTGLPGPLAPGSSQRLVLRLADRDDALLAPLDLAQQARSALLTFPPGRGFASPDGLEVQVARPSAKA